MSEPIQLPKGWVMAADGRPVCLSTLPKSKINSNKLVKKLNKKAQQMRHIMEVFRADCDTEIDQHIQTMFEDHNVKVGGKKGGLSIESIDGLCKIQRSIGGTVMYDETLLIAEELVTKVIDKQRGTKLLKTLAHDAFETNKAGHYDSAKLTKLAKHEFDDPDWKQASQIIQSARYYHGKVPYLRFFIRENVDQPYKPIALDLAKV